jgi:hypothetical protein
MERPPLPIRDCKRGHYHEATEEYWYWQIVKSTRAGGSWSCCECRRELGMLRKTGEIRPRLHSTKTVRLATWGRCGHPRDDANTYQGQCYRCRLDHKREYRINMSALALAKLSLQIRRHKALKRIATRKAKLERDIINGTL